jgi:hypothetical protein
VWSSLADEESAAEALARWTEIEARLSGKDFILAGARPAGGDGQLLLERLISRYGKASVKYFPPDRFAVSPRFGDRNAVCVVCADAYTREGKHGETRASRDAIFAAGLLSVEAYSRKIDADFIAKHDHDAGYSGSHDKAALANKFFPGELLKLYDRVLLVDADVLVTEHAPDVFHYYPRHEFLHAFEQGAFSFAGAADNRGIERLNERLGPVEWPRNPNGTFRQFNTGVVLTSRRHRVFWETLAASREAWDKMAEDGELWPEQRLFNHCLYRLKVPVREMDSRFNHILAFVPPYYPNHRDARMVKERMKAFFIHYTGWQGTEYFTRLIRKDFLRAGICKPAIPSRRIFF